MGVRRRTTAVLGGALGLLLAVAGVALHPLDGSTSQDVEVTLDGLTAASFAASGAALARARPHNPIGWLLLAAGLFEGLAGLGVAAAEALEPGAARTAAAWLASWVWFPAFALLPTLLVALYPTGRAGSRARRLLVVAAATGMTCLTAGFALVDDAVDDIVPGLPNPVAVPVLGIALAIAGAVLLVPSTLLCLGDAVRRLRRSTSPEREQLAWLLATVFITIAVSYTPWQTIRAAIYVLVPVAIAVGVVRHRLLDLQVVVRRTLLFAGLTALVVAVFVATTTALAPLVQGDGIPVAVSAAVVALLLTPARDRLQGAVDRVVYGDRHDPVRAVAGIGRDVARHDGDDLVPQVLATVAAAVRSPNVVLVGGDGTTTAQTGEATDGTPLRLPLRVGGRDVGALLVTPRTPREGWTRADVALLDVLAPHVAVVVHAAHLYQQVAASRDRVVAATRDERDRLRSELHDGLGPALSGIALGLEAAEVSLPRDPARAADLVARLRKETQAAGREVRQLVEGLRPAALEGRDLHGAVQAFLDGLAAGSPVSLRLDVARALPALGADVEAAAYRIVTEAVTNVVRHSGAASCRVALAVQGGELEIVVEDDGTGLPVQPRDGVGLASMRRRASELGGTWTAGPRDGGGTRVHVALPVPAAVTT